MKKIILFSFLIFISFPSLVSAAGCCVCPTDSTRPECKYYFLPTDKNYCHKPSTWPEGTKPQCKVETESSITSYDVTPNCIDFSASPAPQYYQQECDEVKTQYTSKHEYYTPPEQFSTAPIQNETVDGPTLEVPFPKAMGFKFSDVVIKKGEVVWFPWIAEYLKTLHRFGVGVAGILAMVMIMIGGFIWLTAGGNSGKIDSGKKYIFGAIMGLFLALFSVIILNTINPNLTTGLNSPEIYILPELPGNPMLEAGGLPPGKDMKSCDGKEVLGRKNRTLFDAVLLKMADIYNLPCKNLKAILLLESSGERGASSGTAYGPMQFTLETARDICARLKPERRAQYKFISSCSSLQPKDFGATVVDKNAPPTEQEIFNIELGAQYLQRFLAGVYDLKACDPVKNDWYLTGAAYNQGYQFLCPLRSTYPSEEWKAKCKGMSAYECNAKFCATGSLPGNTSGLIRPNEGINFVLTLEKLLADPSITCQ